MSEIMDELKADAARPRRGFLVAAGVASVLAVTAYLYEDVIVQTGGAMAYAFLLIALVILAICLVQCFRSPRLGNRLLGYDVVIVDTSKKIKSDVQYGGGFKSESGADVKRRNSQRKQARHSRRKLAQVTREMHREQAEAAKLDKSE